MKPLHIYLVQVDKDAHSADYVEVTFQDQYLGRNEMWRMGQHLVGQCAYVDEEISFIGLVSARVHSIYIAGKKACYRVYLINSLLSVSICVGLYRIHHQPYESCVPLPLYSSNYLHSSLSRTLGVRW